MTPIASEGAATPRQPPETGWALLDAVGEAILALDGELRVRRCNTAFAARAGLTADALTGRNVQEAVPGFADSPCHRTCLLALQTRTFQEAEETVGDRSFHVRAYPVSEGVVVLIGDVTGLHRAEAERARLQEQVHQTHKHESLGQLAGGMAHDFNNLLGGVLGMADLLLRDLPANSPHRPQVELLKQAGERAAELTQQLLVCAGKGRSQLVPVDLNAVIRDTLPALIAEPTGKTRIVLRLADQLPLISADPGLLRQLVRNLILNAADACGPTDGTITVVTATEGEAGHTVVLEVTDTGCGMTPDVQARIFDPYFSTKRNSRGLGLAMVQGIVRRHKGTIQVRSAPGQGTTIRVLIPTGDDPAKEPRPSAGGADRTAR